MPDSPEARARHYIDQLLTQAAFEDKLVPHDPTDESAIVLVERIRDERAREATKKTSRKIFGKLVTQ